MTLTVVVGSSGSGKTFFLNEVYQAHKCIYIRQYHNIRPYITVTKIPHFDYTQLPYWHIYQHEGTADNIKTGGTMAGEVTVGLSGGQRKLLLFELIVQRVQDKSNLLICLDEPFAGVTEDFIPFIVERLNILKEKHQVVVATNDHVQTLKSLADNTITVSALDRTTVQINHLERVSRVKTILALAVGDHYVFGNTWQDLRFFLDVEVVYNGTLRGTALFTLIVFSLCLATFWDSAKSSIALVLVAGDSIAYFCTKPYLLCLVDWRVVMQEESEALLHSSKGMNKCLKTILTLVVVLIVSGIQYGVTNAVLVDGLNSFRFWFCMLFDSASLTLPFICLGLYSTLPFEAVTILADMLFLFMTFFSTTFSPGSGIPVVKELRYLFARFYFWCLVPGVQDSMEGCPKSERITMGGLVVTGSMGLIIFLVYQLYMHLVQTKIKEKKQEKQRNTLKDREFETVQSELYGKSVALLRHDVEKALSDPSSRHNNQQQQQQQHPDHLSHLSTQGEDEDYDDDDYDDDEEMEIVFEPCSESYDESCRDVTTTSYNESCRDVTTTIYNESCHDVTTTSYNESCHDVTTTSYNESCSDFLTTTTTTSDGLNQV